jgi:hypothetical protein
MNPAPLDEDIPSVNGHGIVATVSNLRILQNNLARADLDQVALDPLTIDKIIFIGPGGCNLEAPDPDGILPDPNPGSRPHRGQLIRLKKSAQGQPGECYCRGNNGSHPTQCYSSSSREGSESLLPASCDLDFDLDFFELELFEPEVLEPAISNLGSW